MIDKDIKFMKIALKEAEKAYEKGEVPIGAVIVLDGKVIAKSQNKRNTSKNATHHAEILAINKACKKLKGWRLEGAELFVTVEPCPMCAGAIANARIKKVYFGAYEKKSGCAISKYPILTDNGLNHSVEFEGGILEQPCATIIKDYFKSKRQKKLDLIK